MKHTKILRINTDTIDIFKMTIMDDNIYNLYDRKI